MKNKRPYAGWTAKKLCSHLGIKSLIGAKLDGLDLRSIDFRNENLSNTSVVGVLWEGADLRGADLRKTKGLSDDILAHAKLDETTKFPNGLTYSQILRRALEALEHYAPTDDIRDHAASLARTLDNPQSKNYRSSNCKPNPSAPSP